MADKVSIDGLAEAISDALEEYTEQVEDDIVRAVYETAAETRQVLNLNSPERTGEYKNSWRVKKVRRGHLVEAVVHNLLYQLVHLLEKGHAKRGGGRVAARPHVSLAEDFAEVQLESKIRRAVEG
jgi:hypothetical protein